MIKPLLKKLDLLIVKAFIGPFIATFFITLFVLVLQFFWLYIDDIVGKGVDVWTVLHLIGYVSATLVPLALPLAVLLSSIMTFGNLGETFELIAIKSAGIPLLRFMRPLALVSVVICYIAFLFNDTIIPIANLKLNTLKYDIIMSKPAFDIKEGVFYDKIEGYVIKIGKKEADDSTIRNVVIYEQNNSGLQDNIIIAEKGKMIVTPDKQSLAFILQNGWLYQERGDRQSTNTEFVRMGFKEYKKVLDLSSFKMNKTEDSTFKNNYQMLSMRQLGRNIDSLEKVTGKFVDRAAKDLAINLKFPKYLDTTGWPEIEKMAPVFPAKGKDPAIYSQYLVPPSLALVRRDSALAVYRKDSAIAAFKRDSAIKEATKRMAKLEAAKGHGKIPSSLKSDSAHKTDTANHAGNIAAQVQPGATPPASKPVPTVTTPAQAAAAATAAKTPAKPVPLTFYDLLPDSAKNAILDRSISAFNGVKLNLDQPSYLYESEQNDLRLHLIAWHEKLTLSVACLVMFLIGAPLGSIIRKGGIGLPLVFAVVFFVIFFLLNNFGKKFVKQDVLTPFAGMWMATYVLTPIGIFLVYKALHDSQLFNKEFYFRIVKRVRSLVSKQKKEISKIS